MKENEQTQNKGWFGRKKNSVTPPQKVSRPPSASSFVQYKRKSPVPEVGATDDGLPPREELPERTGSPRPSPTTETGVVTLETAEGNSDVVEPAPTVPLHAGFDFAAIKDVLRESDATVGGKVSAGLLNPIPEHMYSPASPIPRSGSAPPYTSAHHPPSHSQPSRNFTRDDGGEYIVSGDFAPAFSRTLSLVDTPTIGRNNDFTSVDNALGPEVPAKSPRPSNSSQLSFGSYDGSIWQASNTDVYQSETAASKPSLSLLGEGRENGSYGYLSSSPTINPSVSRSPPMGTIGYEPSTPIVLPPDHEADPWSSLTRGKKPTSGFNSNPWA